MCTAVALFAATSAAAQVGHPPALSPYVDLEHSSELTLLVGYLKTRHDPAGIAPLSRPELGLRYEMTLTGPLALSSEITGAFGNRNVIEPLKPKATRDEGTRSNAVLSGDLALAMNLTGTKSWHRLVPQIRLGIGAVTSRAQDDSSGYSFGTQLAFVPGVGVKFVPGGRLQIRADMTDRIFKMGYPDTYYRISSDNTAVLDATVPRSFYTHHTGFTLGVSYLFGH